MSTRFTLAYAFVAMLSVAGCSGQNFVVIEDAPLGAKADQTLGMRTATDLSALSPTSKYSWLELCDKVVVPTLRVFTATHYVNCAPADHLQQMADKSNSTGYVAGIVAPVIQGAAIAYAGHEIGQGIGRSGSKTTNNNTGGNGNGTASTSQSQRQSQDQSQHQRARGGEGGQGGNGGEGGQGGNGCPGHSCDN